MQRFRFVEVNHEIKLLGPHRTTSSISGSRGKLTNHNTIWREAQHHNPRAYLEGAARGYFISVQAPIARADLPCEFMMNALHLD